MAVPLAVAGDVFDGVFLCCPFFQRDVLDEIWDLIESVSEGFPTYFYIKGIIQNSKQTLMLLAQYHSWTNRT